MKPAQLFSLFFGLWLSLPIAGQPRPAPFPPPSTTLSEKTLRANALAFLNRFRAHVQALGDGADSATWPRRQTDLLSLFNQPTQTLPNLLVTRMVFQQDHPSITAQTFVRQLPRHFWKGFRIEIDSIVVQQIDLARQTVNLRVPIGIRGIRSDTRQPHRVGEWWIIRLQADPIQNSLMRIVGITGTRQWLYADPLTRYKAQQIQGQLLDWVSVWFNPSQSATLRRQACEQLRKTLTTDTIFLRQGDKETYPLSIKECEALPRGALPNRKTAALVTFSLDYVTEIHPSTGGTLIGERTHLDSASPAANTGVWYQARRTDPVPVPAQRAGGQLSYWQITQLTIHL
ncbi:hypothetical protein GCM10023189_10460 [Nibrella saemangeumensis]|uniref:Uncharacterized protein n=1 Tax=Nibrella saemangeumensis TaxID=1084526 RepID=A0ABP8MIU2_9BACT